MEARSASVTAAKKNVKGSLLFETKSRSAFSALNLVDTLGLSPLSGLPVSLASERARGETTSEKQERRSRIRSLHRP